MTEPLQRMQDTLTRDIKNLQHLVKRCEDSVATRCSHEEVERWLDKKIDSFGASMSQRQEDTLKRLTQRQQDSLNLLQERNGESWRHSLARMAEIEEKCVLRKDLPTLLSKNAPPRAERIESRSTTHSEEDVRLMDRRLSAVEQKTIRSATVDSDVTFCAFRALVGSRLEGLATALQSISSVICNLEASKIEQDVEANRLEVWADDITVQFQQAAGKLLSTVEDYVSNRDKDIERKLQLKVNHVEVKMKTIAQSAEQRIDDVLRNHTTHMNAHIAQQIAATLERVSQLEQQVTVCENDARAGRHQVECTLETKVAKNCMRIPPTFRFGTTMKILGCGMLHHIHTR
eukprot:GEMP01048953.1.p1 GENE.GEMP01048953.1~~GEMP01048953.1.p1  ORF type:complete len:381 (-),score=93.78 GEMP01048953.1:535-1569(-)